LSDGFFADGDLRKTCRFARTSFSDLPISTRLFPGGRACYTSLLRNFPVVAAACEWADRPEPFDALAFTDSANFSDADSLASSLDEEGLLLFAAAFWDTCLWLVVA
jgi:hypothetical protein